MHIVYKYYLYLALAFFTKYKFEIINTTTTITTAITTIVSYNFMALPATLPLLSSDITSTENDNLEESDEELFMVPEMEEIEEEEEKTMMQNGQGSLQSSSNNNNVNVNNNNNNNNNGEVAPPKRKRGRNPVDKEYRRLKRLLRNRVSAQQARERKKVYVNDLESRAKDLQEMNFKLESKISTLVNENTMLRKILLNTRPKKDDSEEPKCE